MKKESQLLDTLSKAILSGEYEIGEKLPAERELVFIYGYSRQTVHNALIRLENTGLVEIKPRHGVVVANFKEDGDFKLLESIISIKRDQLTKELLTDILEFLSYNSTYIGHRAQEHFDLDYANQILDQYEAGDGKSFFTFYRYMAKSSKNVISVMMVNSFKIGFYNVGQQVLDSGLGLEEVIKSLRHLAYSIKHQPTCVERCNNETRDALLKYWVRK